MKSFSITVALLIIAGLLYLWLDEYHVFDVPTKIQPGQCWVIPLDLEEPPDTIDHYIVRVKQDSAECLIQWGGVREPYIKMISLNYLHEVAILDSNKGLNIIVPKKIKRLPFPEPYYE